MEARAGSVTPLALNTTELLEKEGRELHHCVGSCAEDCNDGFIRVFSLLTKIKTDQHSRYLSKLAFGLFHRTLDFVTRSQTPHYWQREELSPRNITPTPAHDS